MSKLKPLHAANTGLDSLSLVMRETADK